MKRYSVQRSKQFEKNIKELFLREQLDIKKVLIKSNNYFMSKDSNMDVICGWVGEFNDVAGKLVTFDRYLHSPKDEKYFNISSVEGMDIDLMDIYTQYTYSTDMIDYAYFKYCPEYVDLYNNNLKRFDDMSDTELKQYVSDLKTTLKQ